MSFLMNARAQQLCLVTCLIMVPLPLSAALSVGQTYVLECGDVDGHKLSTGDGHTSALVIAPISDVDKARTIADRIPDYCIGNPHYRMITVIAFKKDTPRSLRGIVLSIIRRRLNAEAKRLQPRYTAKKLTRNPRNDVLAVADFDGRMVARLGSDPKTVRFAAFAFGPNGKLLRQWNDLPTAQDLAATLK